MMNLFLKLIVLSLLSFLPACSDSDSSEEEQKAVVPTEEGFVLDTSTEFKGTVISSGMNHSCGVAKGGLAYCWGIGSNGQLGNGEVIPAFSATPIKRITSVLTISSGNNHSCTIDKDKNAWCWGYNNYGQLGSSSVQTNDTFIEVQPRKVENVSKAASIVAGATHSCAVSESGKGWCWGLGTSGQLGDQDINIRPQAVEIKGLQDITTISLGSTHTCALKKDGTVWCWGLGTSGQLGDGEQSNKMIPNQVPGLKDVISLSVRNNSTCVVIKDGIAYCWGVNSNGQLGTGNTSTVLSPTRVEKLSGLASISLGISHACALTTDGVAYCWGTNTYGQLGNGKDTKPKYHPDKVANLKDIHSISSGGNHTCAVLLDGSTWCWGNGQYGQVGDTKERAVVYTPTRVEAAKIAKAEEKE